MLARLLAGENLTVVHNGEAETASFDLQNRTLTMPVLANMTPEVYDLFVGHEVSHALNTKLDEWKQGVEQVSGGVKSLQGLAHSCLNIVEDVRIERLIQAQFPGLRRSFVHGYRALWAQDFFGASEKDLSPEGIHLLDRLNIHFKAGAQSGVQFSADEQAWLDRFDDLSTWADVQSLAQDLFDFSKQEQDQPETPQDSFEGDDDQGESAPGFESDDQDDQESGSGDDEGDTGEQSGDESGEGSDEGEETKGDGSMDSADEAEDDGSNAEGESRQTQPDDPESSETDSGSTEENGAGACDEPGWTQRHFNQKLKDVAAQSQRGTGNIELPEANLDRIVVPCEELHANLFQHWSSRKVDLAAGEAAWDRVNKGAVGTMVKEFDIQKAADEWRRTETGKTGLLDMNRLHEYRFNDDIFKTRTTIRDGKNHGFVFFIDWSGSMDNVMADTLDQLLNMISFCKRAGVPCDVYAFADKRVHRDPWADAEQSGHDFKNWVSTYSGSRTHRLWHLASTDLKGRKWQAMFRNLIAVRDSFMGTEWGGYAKNSYIPRFNATRPSYLGLTGTPLQECMVCAVSLVAQFQERHGVQVMNTVFLTDGDGCDSLYYKGDLGYENDAVLVDPKTHRQYPVNSRGKSMGREAYKNMDDALLALLKDRTGCNLLGVRVTHESLTSKKTKAALKDVVNDTDEGFTWDIPCEFRQALKNIDPKMAAKRAKSMLDFGFCESGWSGFDTHFIVAGKNLKIDQTDHMGNLGANGKKVTLRSAKSAFKKSLGGNKAARMFASQFVAAIAS